MPSDPHGEDSSLPTPRATAARTLVELLEPLLNERQHQDLNQTDGSGGRQQDIGNILAATQALVSALWPGRPLFAAFHDGQVHHPLGGAAYAFEKDLIGPLLSALANDEALTSVHRSEAYQELTSAHPGDSVLNARRGITDCKTKHDSKPQLCTRRSGFAGAKPPLAAVPTRPIIVHAGAQPNNSPHAGTLVVFCYAFLLARQLRNRVQALASGDAVLPAVLVEISLVDTAPVCDEGLEIDGVQYQRSYRDVPAALATHMADYDEALCQMSAWSGIPFRITFQSDFFSHPSMPSLLAYLVEHRGRLASQLLPKHNSLALRAACPISNCALAEKHGRLNRYLPGRIHFDCPRHGEHSISFSNSKEVASLEANAPTRNLLRSMLHLLDESTHHIWITGADYAGTYQEAFLYRPLAEWSATTGLAAGRTPHILYTPLVVDWSGAKLSKGLYVRQGGYDAMDTLGTDGLRSYTRLKSKHGLQGLSQIWTEVERWLADPHKLFRASFSVEYLQGVLSGRRWQ